MATTEKKRKTCEKGHHYYKSSDCPTCPICETERKPSDGILSQVSAPARRALESLQIENLHQLSRFTEKEIKQLHGMGPAAIKILKASLEKENLSFKK
ncbi:hypothetical protein MUN88_18820 [Gracilibacillus caseinilyticus]|uniref:RNA polymerase, alpha chain C terminal domain n=1 Tax=Gracilibacillus caseinilyticus TaxID=2932256 RepID=A0ABY4EUJ7_9BACI|nr:hypothetical protein [Gracilibacillus caseinilyticus]UOQ48082.1 hypothetical protein MUN88_18820 [Gracilibacillus caseinilyticus]